MTLILSRLSHQTSVQWLSPHHSCCLTDSGYSHIHSMSISDWSELEDNSQVRDRINHAGSAADLSEDVRNEIRTSSEPHDNQYFLPLLKERKQKQRKIYRVFVA